MSLYAYSLAEVGGFALALLGAVIALEAYLYAHFYWYAKRGFVPSAACAAAAIGWIFGGWGWALAGFAAQGAASLVFKHLVRGRWAFAYMLVAPAVLGFLLLVVYPFCFQAYLAFHDLKLTTIMQWSRTGQLPFVGFKQFLKVFTTPPLAETTFWALLGRTIWWTFVNVSLHVLGGLGLALLLNRPLRFKGVYRTLLIVPWAMPQVVAVLALRGEFHSQYGFVNAMLQRLGFAPVQWLSQHALLTCTIINVWLGIPFMMVIILGGLQSISKHYYDAAAIDGASAWQQFRAITVPLLRPVLAPAVTLGAVWTFNNINVIYLVTGQAGGFEDADILVSALYKAAFTYYRYSYSAAFALVIFGLLFAASTGFLRASRASESVYG